MMVLERHATILVIDDNLDVITSVQRAIPAHWQCLSARNGKYGLQLALDHLAELDLVMLDMRLPDVDGSSVCALLRRYRADIWIVPFSAYPESAYGLTALGCNALLRKPASRRDIQEAIVAAMSQPPPTLTPSPLLDLIQSQAEKLLLGAAPPPPAAPTIPKTEQATAIIALIAQRGPLTTREIQMLIPLSIHIRTLQRTLTLLVSSQVLQKRGHTNRIRYHLPREKE